MKLLAILGFIFLLAAVTTAQNGYTIAGTVRDTNGPVGGAVVTLTAQDEKEAKYRKKTDAQGFFGFHAERGTYTLKVEKLSGNMIVASASENVEIEITEPKHLNITLAEATQIRETVNVSADFSQPVDEVSKTVNVITAQEMRERADFTLVDTLRTIPGFRVQQLGGFGRTASIKTRGLRNSDTAVLIDGIRFRDASAITGDASPFLSDFTLTSVSRIEVLRGSGSSLYGTNAIGGAVDFQTPTPQPGWHGQLSGAVGGLGLGRFRGNVSKGTKDSKFGFNAAVSRTAYTKGIDGNDDANNTNFQSRIEINPTAKTNISARFFVSDAFVRLNSNPDTFVGTLPPVANSTIIDANPNVNFTFDADDPDSVQNSDFFNGQFVLTQIITNELSFQGYYSGLKTSRTNDNDASTSIFDGLIQTANGHFDWTPNSANRLTLGYEFEHEKFGNDGRTPSGSGDFFTRARQSGNTFFVQDLVSLLNGRLQLAGGFRAQVFSLSGPEFSVLNAPYSNLTLENPPTAYTFDGAASYFFESTGTKLRAHVGNGYRVPSLFERFGTFFSTFGPMPEFIALGDPNLEPERSIAFDGGIEQTGFNDKLRLTAVYFYTKLTDIIGFGNFVPPIGNTGRPFGGYENQKGGIARGAEFSGTLKPMKSTDIFASYTYTNSDQREPQVSGSGIIRTLGIPDHQFTLVATQRFEQFWVNFDFLATSSYLAPIFDTNNFTFQTYIYRFRGNRRADLTAGYTFLLNKDKFNMRLFGTVENLFGYEYFENGFRTPDRNARIGLSFGF